MNSALATLDHQYLEMRWRCLSLAADLDRISAAADGPRVLRDDPRLVKLMRAVRVLLEAEENRAEQVQMIFSDLDK